MFPGGVGDLTLPGSSSSATALGGRISFGGVTLNGGGSTGQLLGIAAIGLAVGVVIAVLAKGGK